MKYRVKWVAVPTAWLVIKIVIGGGVQMQWVAACVLNKQARTADCGGPPSWIL
jgi:hypothetical protein